MFRPKRVIFWLRMTLLVGIVLVLPKLTHASILNDLTDNFNFLINEIKTSFTDLAHPVSAPVIAIRQPAEKQSQKINIIVAKPLENPPAVVVNPIPQVAKVDTTIIHDSTIMNDSGQGKANVNTHANAWTLLTQVQKNLEHISQSISELMSSRGAEPRG